MRNMIILATIIVFVCGCSSSSSSVTPDLKDKSPVAAWKLPQTDRWNWNLGLYRVSEDHKRIEGVATRTTDWHLNVNYFVEPPSCDDCLVIGQPDVQPDGTIIVDVTLRHPFPNQPEYTGFDVRGTVMFHATRYWHMIIGKISSDYGFPVFEDTIPLYFPLSKDGGGELLNRDGYTMYLFPGLDLGPEFSAAIFNYSKGEHAMGPEPDSTISGYKVFTNDPDRRMFLVSETITRTYHIAPPGGPFFFGYVVDASWAPPTVKPVTDPANDFPFWANAEDGYIVETEQLAPFKTGTYTNNGYPVTRLTLQTHRHIALTYWSSMRTDLICPDINTNPIWPVGVDGGLDWYDDDAGLYCTTQGICGGTYKAEPGYYPAILMVHYFYFDGVDDTKPPREFFGPLDFAVIDLQVIN